MTPTDINIKHSNTQDLRLPLCAPGMRIGLMGGSFNPPHEGHRHISLLAIKRLGLDKIWWLVTPGNPLKNHDHLAPLSERIQRCRILARNPKIAVTGFEACLASAYTAATLAHLNARFPTVNFVWIMGADNLSTFHLWHGWNSIMKTLPIAVIDRPFWHYKAISSKAAQCYLNYRLAEEVAYILPLRTPPAWSYLTGPLSFLSSTELRKHRSA